MARIFLTINMSDTELPSAFSRTSACAPLRRFIFLWNDINVPLFYKVVLCVLCVSAWNIEHRPSCRLNEWTEFFFVQFAQLLRSNMFFMIHRPSCRLNEWNEFNSMNQCRMHSEMLMKEIWLRCYLLPPKKHQNDKNTTFLTFFMNFINPYVREIPYLCPRIVTMPMVTTHHRRLCLRTIVWNNCITNIIIN